MSIYGTFVSGPHEGEEVVLDSDEFEGPKAEDILEKAVYCMLNGQRYRIEKVHYDTWNFHFDPV